MYKTIRILKKERDRMNNWRKFMRIFKAYAAPVPAVLVDKIMGYN